MNDIQNMLDALDAPEASAWIPETGDYIVGKILALSSADHGYGPTPIVTLEVLQGTDNGNKIEVPDTRAVHCMGIVLRESVWRDGLEDQWIAKTGGMMAVKHNGKQMSKAGNEYAKMKVQIQPPAPGQELADAVNDESLFG